MICSHITLQEVKQLFPKRQIVSSDYYVLHNLELIRAIKYVSHKSLANSLATLCLCTSVETLIKIKNNP